MYQLKYSKQFRKDFKRLQRGHFFPLQEFNSALDSLINGVPLGARFLNHKLSGTWRDCYECHLRPDMLFIYTIEKETNFIYLLRLGSHTELFKL